jgi:hypothetical protein
MTQPFHLPLGDRPCLRNGIRTSVLIVASLSSFAASAQTYPVSGVWVAMERQFPESQTGACLMLKTIGAKALFGGSFPTVMIFSDGQRFVVREGRSLELAVTSVKSVKDDSFRITETLSKHGSWLPWLKNRAFYLKIVHPTLIEIADWPVRTHFFKCWSKLTPL